ncbi:MAG: hypothetical protein Q7K39_01805 [Candidatus Magasanikbacteria bacterium]|nr:hypothetical protein [Candidatus Magasanikbacteria bacterium]
MEAIDSPARQSSIKDFERLREKVFVERPVLADIITKHGEMSLYEYALDYLDVNETALYKSRRPEFLSSFSALAGKFLPPAVAQSACQQLEKYFFVSTSDHHGPLTHPFFLSSNLLNAVVALEANDPVLENIIVLACGSVSLDNSSFPRGLVFNSPLNSTNQLLRSAFFSSHERPSLVHLLRPYSKAELDKGKSSLDHYVKQKVISPQVVEMVGAIIDEIYAPLITKGLPSYAAQVTASNYNLWRKFFSHADFKKIPNLVYLELEDMVSRLLVDYHLKSGSYIYDLLFNDDFQNSVIKYLDGKLGSFCLDHKTDTFLFWAVPNGERYRKQLWKNGNRLCSDDGQYSIDLTPEAIKKALEKKEIMPSLLLDFVVLALYYGLKCLGGFSQVNYLTGMKQGFIQVLTELGKSEEISSLEVVQTKELVGDITLAFIKTQDGQTIPATGLDLALYANGNLWSTLISQSKIITLKEAMSPMMPEFYRMIYFETEREPALSAVTSETIARLIQLDKKIKPCIVF